MFLVYIDDSGDEKVRCYSALLFHESVWKDAERRIREFRRCLKHSDGMYVTRELHATEFVAGRGQVGPSIVPKGRRCAIFRETLSLIAEIPNVKLMNCVASRSNEKLVFERLVNRINRTMNEWKSNALILHDEGKDYSSLVRRMSVYNPVRSQYGRWPDGNEYRNFPTNRILEDIIYRKSQQSTFIQMADFCAYALFRSEYPLASKTRYGLDSAFRALEPICVHSASKSDPRGLGIIRCP